MAYSEKNVWLLLLLSGWAVVLATISVGAVFSGGRAGFEFVNALAQVTWWFTGAFVVALSLRVAFIAGGAR